MDKLLLRGEQLNVIARRFSVSPDAIFRHKKHMQVVMVKAAAVTNEKDVAYGSSLLAEVARIRADAERLQLESESRRDLRGALRAIHERLAVVELEAKLSGQIETSQKNVTINVQAISTEEAVEYARDILELFAPTPPPDAAPPSLVIEGGPGISVEGGCDGN